MANGKTIIYYYTSARGENPVKEFIDSLEERQQVKILRIFQLIEEYGLRAASSHAKKVTGTPLWEIRTLGKDNIRILYIVPEKSAVLALHGFVKKKRKTPRKELDMALNRYQLWKGG